MNNDEKDRTKQCKIGTKRKHDEKQREKTMKNDEQERKKRRKHDEKQ